MLRTPPEPQHVRPSKTVKDAGSTNDIPTYLYVTSALHALAPGERLPKGHEPLVRSCPCGCEADLAVVVDRSERGPGGRKRSPSEVERVELAQLAAGLEALHPDVTQRTRAEYLSVAPSTYSKLLSRPDRASAAPPAQVLWTDARVKAAMRAWFERHGRWPSRGDWSPHKFVERGDSTAPARVAAFRKPWCESDLDAPGGRRERRFPSAGAIDFRRLLVEAQAEARAAAVAHLR